ncbi:hypothetical protein A165_12750 [Vibrio tasmaniensis ZS-17]|uniref:hypothetical protein n=1 Tax=Vibrio tasmaniensis TaxID=212663 RepID=UPI0002FC94BB|nr:hypothetical protein [Vibrio tasmaniensis]OED62450.1 hypothetical protein A165_12750 [Vibrio tasmaniensis ZS-17]
MKQGSISDKAWCKLSAGDKGSLGTIRHHFIKHSKCSKQLSIDLELVDRSYEAMGHRFRNRVNKSVREYGRYVGEFDGVFLIIKSAIRTFHSSNLFPETSGDALSRHKFYRKQRSKATTFSAGAFGKLERVIDWVSHTATTVYEQDELTQLKKNLKDIELVLERHFKRADFTDRGPSQAESFVLSVCNHLVWEANIKPTKPLASTGEKSPLLRFIEVFFPLEGQLALSSIYEKQKRLPEADRIGEKFIPVNRG